MNHPFSLFHSVALLVLGAASLMPAQAQQANVAPRRVVSAVAPGSVSNGEQAKPLSSNHRVVFSGKTGEKAVGELSLLTASPSVRISGPLDASNTPTTFNVSGTIQEREGGLIFFEYTIGFEVPVSTGSNTQYYNHTCTGSLVMKAGKAYEILKTGGIIHSVMITPEPDK